MLIPAIIAYAMTRFLQTVFLTPIDSADTTPVFVEIAPGKSFRAIAQDIESKKLIRYWWSLEVLGRIRKQAAVISVGEYELSRSMNATEILEKLSKGDTFKRRITIKEGASIWGIGSIIEEAGLGTKADFEKVVTDPQVIGQLGIQAASLGGYLFPETYLFSKPITVLQIVRRLVEQGNRMWDSRLRSQAESIHLSRHEVLTLASIIEKETGMVTEQGIISSVFHNRLKQGMKLQTDPTVIYGIPNFNGNLTKADLEKPSPYNTYVNYGLPPGPIANPGKSAIEAALFPSTTQFLYFVADGTGGHFFSTTLAEHNQAVNRFQRNR